MPSSASNAASGAATSAADDRWSGSWQVEGQVEEGGDFVEFGVLTLELVTDGSLNLLEPDWPCVDGDLDYRGSYAFGGGGTLVGCESSKFDGELSMEYYANQPEGAWGQADMTFTPGSPPTWAGYYSPATTNPAGEFAYLQWRATRLDDPGTCAPPEASVNRSSSQAQAPCSITLDFAFSHGGKPKEAPRRVVDVSTNGIGTMTYTPAESASEWTFEDGVIKVVREMEVVENDPDTVATISERRIVLGLRHTKSPFTLRSPKPGDVVSDMRIPLKVERSNDPQCSKSLDGKARRASLFIDDDPDKDAGSLRIEECPHHYFVFFDSKRMTVTVVIDPIK